MAKKKRLGRPPGSKNQKKASKKKVQRKLKRKTGLRRKRSSQKAISERSLKALRLIRLANKFLVDIAKT